jgi:hypothetical protein
MHGRYTILYPVEIIIVHAIKIFVKVHPRTVHESPKGE